MKDTQTNTPHTYRQSLIRARETSHKLVRNCQIYIVSYKNHHLIDKSDEMECNDETPAEDISSSSLHDNQEIIDDQAEVDEMLREVKIAYCILIIFF